MLHDAEVLTQEGQAAAVPLALKPLAAKDDGAALLLIAKAYEQTGNTTSALANYRRLYFYAGGYPEASQASAALTHLNSSIAPANEEEATTRAQKLFEVKHYSDAYDAYTTAFANFPGAVNPTLQMRRVIAAAEVRKFPEAAAALNSMSTSAGESRAEAMFNFALWYGYAKQWTQARSVADELHRTFPGSIWSTRAFVQLGQYAEQVKDDPDASYFYRAAVNFYPSATEVTPAQFYIACAAHEAKNYSNHPTS